MQTTMRPTSTTKSSWTSMETSGHEQLSWSMAEKKGEAPKKKVCLEPDRQSATLHVFFYEIVVAVQVAKRHTFAHTRRCEVVSLLVCTARHFRANSVCLCAFSDIVWSAHNVVVLQRPSSRVAPSSQLLLPFQHVAGRLHGSHSNGSRIQICGHDASTKTATTTTTTRQGRRQAGWSQRLSHITHATHTPPPPHCSHFSSRRFSQGP